MGIFNEPNRDEMSLSPGEVSPGPTLGFFEGFAASIDAQVRYFSQFGAAVNLRDEEGLNIDRIRRLNEEPPSALGEGVFGLAPPTGKYSEFNDAITKGDAGAVSSLIGPRNDQLKALKARYPTAGILTYDEMFDAVRRKSDEALRRSQLPHDFGGQMGAFLGGMAGGLDPRTSPTSFAALPVGGFGKTILTRIATQALGQAGVQAFEEPQIAVNKTQLGGKPTLEEAAGEVLAAGIGGAGVQGAGEALGVGLRYAFPRWFTGPDAPPPPPPPKAPRAPQSPVQGVDVVIRDMELGRTAVGRARAASDLEGVARQLNDWEEPISPADLVPPTDTRLPWFRTAGSGELPAPMLRSVQGAGETVDEIARRLDPETFRIYDKLVERRDNAREVLRAATSEEETTRAAVGARATIDTALDAARAKLQKATTNKQRAKAQAEVDALEAQARQLQKGSVADVQGRPANYVAEVRDEATRIDHEMRDMAPTITRAYARAQKKWDVYEGQRAEIQSMVENGRRTTDMPMITKAAGAAPSSTTSPLASMLARAANDPDVKVKAGASNADIVAATVQQDLKVLDEAVEAYRTSIGGMLKEGEQEVSIQGINYKLKLDKDRMKIEDEDGTIREVTIRQILEDTRDDNAALQAVTTCSPSKTS